MIETNTILSEALCKALETMAFMIAEPPEQQSDVPAESYLARMHFEGPVSGTIEILAGCELTRSLAMNISGDEQAEQDKSVDALKELLNVTCGLLLPLLPSLPTDTFEFTVPELVSTGDAEHWQQFVTQDDVVVLDVSGELLATRLTVRG